MILTRFKERADFLYRSLAITDVLIYIIWAFVIEDGELRSHRVEEVPNEMKS